MDIVLPIVLPKLKKFVLPNPPNEEIWAKMERGSTNFSDTQYHSRNNTFAYFFVKIHTFRQY